MNIEKVPLGKHVKVEGGFAFQSAKFSENGIPIIRISNIIKGKIDTANCVKYPKESFENFKRYEVKEGDILIAMSGATTGKVGVVRNIERKVLLNQRLGNFKIKNENNLLKEFLYRIVQNPEYQKKLKNIASGCAQPNISAKQLESIEVTIPPLPTQNKIVAILEKAEKLKGWRREADELTDEFLKSTFLEMFGDPVKNPKGWEMRNLGEVAEVSSGLTLNSQRRANKENLFPYLRVANVYRNKLDLNEIKYIHVSDLEFERFLLKKNDVLIVEGHGNIEEIGRAAIWNGEIPNCLHQNHIIKVRLNDNYISHSFLSFFLNFYGNYGYFSSKSRTTSGLNTISTNKVRKAKIPLPPVSMQKKFAEIYKSIEQLREHQTQSHQHIYDLFNALVQQAFRGELSI